MLPSSRFILTVHEVTQTNLNNLDRFINQYLKRWAGLPRSATPSILHIDQFYAIKTIKELYEESHSISYTSTRLKGDATVSHAMDTKMARESNWTGKSSTIMQSAATFESAIALPSPPSPSIGHIKSKVKTIVHTKHQSYHWSHITSLAMQGEFCRLWELQEADYTWKADICNLPRGIAKFLINSTLNTLPTRDNLTRWGKTISAACDRCGNRETMHHVLSGCPTSLDQGRYTWRHDSVLNRIQEIVSKTQDSNVEVFCDAGGRPWTIPPDILPTSDRPDLVILKRETNTILIFELTVPYELNIKKDHQYKCHKYTSH